MSSFVTAPDQPPPLVLRTSSSITHLSYTLETLPSKPSDAWTRFVCVSDTHARAFPVPPGDVLLHGGDLTEVGRLDEFRATVEWLRELPHPHKIIIAGNHDLTLHQQDGWYAINGGRWHRSIEPVESILDLLKGEEALEAGLVYLQDEKYEFRTKPNGRTWSVWGSPWSPEFYNWAFNYKRNDGERLVANIPLTDILLTHGPPSGILDRVRFGEGVGCTALRTALDAGQLRPRLHVFGHIHEDHGALVRPAPGVGPPEETVFVNAASWPAGPRARKGGVRTPFGTGDFVPVVVDLLDEPGSSRL